MGWFISNKEQIRVSSKTIFAGPRQLAGELNLTQTPGKTSYPLNTIGISCQAIFLHFGFWVGTAAPNKLILFQVVIGR